jgi:hypothetical protein
MARDNLTLSGSPGIAVSFVVQASSQVHPLLFLIWLCSCEYSVSINRRQFIKYATVGSLSTGMNLAFAKVSHSFSYSYLLSRDARSDAVFRNLVSLDIARNVSNDLSPEVNVAVAQVVADVQQEFTGRDFNVNPTPFSQRLGNVNHPLWGRQRTEALGPNPGFGTIQTFRNIPSSVAFTGSTTAGIETSMRILTADENADPVELDGLLIPTRERFADWGSWEGEVDPNTGQVINPFSFATYETRLGDVLRTYEVKEPGRGGFGEIRLTVDSFRSRRMFTIRVDFD